MVVDAKVQQAVQAAQPAKFKYWPYILKALVFHLFFVPTSLLYLPLYILRAYLPYYHGRYKNWTALEALGVFITQRAMRNLVRFRMQPLPPREKGWREMNNIVGGFLSLVNLSGPGGLVSSAPPVFSQVSEYTREGRRDRDWFDAPPLEDLKGILSIKVDDNQVVDSSEYQGPALVEPKWAKTRVKGFWFMHNHLHHPVTGPLGTQKRPVLLYFHGGAAVTFAAGDVFMGQTLCRTLARKAEIDVFSVDYYLAPFAPFPVQILQALAGYLHLRDTYGYHPSQIYLGGDSFGSWLALQLEHYLRGDGKSVTADWDNKAPTKSGVPGLILISPWVCAYDIRTPSRDLNGVGHRYDILEFAYGHWGVDALQVGPKHKDRCPAPLESPWLSPLCYPKSSFAEIPPAFVCLGSVEALFDEDMLFVKEIQSAGGQVELYVDEGGVHDYGTMSTFSERFNKTCSAMRQWLQKIQSS